MRRGNFSTTQAPIFNSPQPLMIVTLQLPSGQFRVITYGILESTSINLTELFEGSIPNQFSFGSMSIMADWSIGRSVGEAVRFTRCRDETTIVSNGIEAMGKQEEWGKEFIGATAQPDHP
jgi:hypothetical protein